ncbi:MAG: AMIN domain-containing protein, partial [Gammaproteobacteria bacterium]|nr:AMIN domain-containing protein [Gammaproteobacteria bacterium]
MKIKLSRITMALLIAALSPMLLAANLQALDVASLPGDKVELKLTFDQPVAAPQGYTIGQPARIALDLPGVKNKLSVKRHELGDGNARSVSIVEANDRTRLIINLTTLAPYNTRVEGKHVYVVVGEAASVHASAPRVSAPMARPALAPSRGISNIDFQRGDKGEGNVIIELNDPSST